MSVDNTKASSKSFFRENVFNFENLRISMMTREPASASAFSSSKARYAPMHTHLNYEYICCGEDEQQMIFGDKKVSMSHGDSMIILPGVMHKCEKCTKGSIGLQFDISSNGVDSGVDLYGIMSDILSTDEYVIINNQPEIGQILLKIDENEENGNLLSMGLLFYELISKTIVATNSIPIVSDSRDSDSLNMRQYKLQTLIHANFMHDISLEEVADTLHLSPRQTSRIVKEYFGCTFKDLIVRMRMEKAKDLISNFDLNIVEIAQSVGYNSIRGFYSAFKKFYGCLPKEYKKNIIE